MIKMKFQAATFAELASLLCETASNITGSAPALTPREILDTDFDKPIIDAALDAGATQDEAMQKVIADSKARLEILEGGQAGNVVNINAADEELDADGCPWDARINTANRSKRQDDTWKRKPRISDEEYLAVIAEIKRANPAAEATIDPVATIDPGGVAAATVAAVVDPAGVRTDAVAGPLIDMGQLTEKATAMVQALGALGPTALGQVLTAYGALTASPDGGITQGVPQLSVLPLACYPKFIMSADTIIANAVAVAANPAMIPTLIAP